MKSGINSFCCYKYIVKSFGINMWKLIECNCDGVEFIILFVGLMIFVKFSVCMFIRNSKIVKKIRENDL